MFLTKFNHWWTVNSVNKDLVGQAREAFNHILSFLGKRQILLLMGLRRVGKTTLMFQLIDYLLNKLEVNPLHILYFSFDEEREELDKILEEYQISVLKMSFSEVKNKLYFFFDEVQKLKDWVNKLKILYDLNPNIKIIISGSASLNLLKESKESLAGRIYDFKINPLDFREFLKFKKVTFDPDRLNIYREIIQKEIESYLKNSGFIEVIFEREEKVLKKYFKESLLEQVLFRDIQDTFSINEPRLLMVLIKILSSKPGMLVEFQNIANDLNRDQRTIANYFEFLRLSFLTKSLYNFSRNLLTSEKKLKKYYLSYPAFCLALKDFPIDSEYKGLLIENLLVSCEKSLFFYRSPSKWEVDLIKTEGEEIIPVEVKYQESISTRDLKGLKNFMGKFKVKKGILISKDLESKLDAPVGTIEVIPIWKYLLWE